MDELTSSTDGVNTGTLTPGETTTQTVPAEGPLSSPVSTEGQIVAVALSPEQPKKEDKNEGEEVPDEESTTM